MYSALAVVADAQQFAEQFLLHLRRVRRNRALEVFHGGVLIVVVVAVGVQHQQRARRAPEAGDVIHTEVQLLDHLHLLTGHTDVLHLLQPAQGNNVLLIDLVVHFLGVALHLTFVEHAVSQGALRRGGFFLADKQFHTPALGGVLQRLRLLRLNQRQGLCGEPNRRNTPEAVLVTEGVREVEHVLTRCVHLYHDTVLAQIGQTVRAFGHVIAATDSQPQALGVAEHVALDIDESVA